MRRRPIIDLSSIFSPILIIWILLLAPPRAAAFQETWDDGNGFSGWEFEDKCQPYNFALIREPGRSSNYVLRVENRLVACGGRARTEIKLNTVLAAKEGALYGQDFWWRFRVYIPSNWPTSKMPVGWLTIAQIIPGSYATGWAPDFKLVIRNDHYWAWHGPGGKTFGPIKRGAWTEWVIHYKRSTGSGGISEAWMNGKKVVNYQGKTTFANLTRAPTKFGIYASLPGGSHGPYVLYFDDLVTSASPLTPGGTAPATPPPPTPVVPPPPVIPPPVVPPVVPSPVEIPPAPSEGLDPVTQQGPVWDHRMEPPLVNGVEFLHGQAVFDTDTDYLAVSMADMSPEQGTVDMWVLATDGGKFLFGHTTWPPWNNRIQITKDGTVLSYRLGSSDPVVATHVMVPNVWTHVVLTYDRGAAQLYVNGQPDRGSAYTGLTQLHTFAHVGNAGDTTPDQAWRGRVARVRLWPRALTAVEVESISRAQVP